MNEKVIDMQKWKDGTYRAEREPVSGDDPGLELGSKITPNYGDRCMPGPEGDGEDPVISLPPLSPAQIAQIKRELDEMEEGE